MFADMILPSRGRTIAVLVIATPIASALLLRAYCMRNIDSYSSGRQEHGKKKKKQQASPKAEPALPQSFPLSDAAADVDDGNAIGIVLSYERLVSKPMRLASMGWDVEHLSEMLTRYVRATMFAFTQTPQAGMIRKMTPPDVWETFEGTYINEMDFSRIDQRVDGVYTVQYRGGNPGVGKAQGGGERVELRLDPPPGFPDAGSDGIIVAAVEPVGESGDVVRFVNETWLWRKAGQAPTFLESAAGRWFHSLMAAWLINRGTSALRSGSTI